MWKKLLRDTQAGAVVEAAILFPIMIMIFYAMVLLAIYLPQRTILQEGAQAAAEAIATEASDTYVAFDNEGNRIEKDLTANVYVAAIQGVLGSGLDADAKAEGIVRHCAGKGIFSVPGEITAECSSVNYVIYQEIVVTARQKIPIPVDFSFIGFPKELELVQEARAVVQNGDEFVRNIDIAKDMVTWLDKKLGISQNLKDSKALEKVHDVLAFFQFGG